MTAAAWACTILGALIGSGTVLTVVLAVGRYTQTRPRRVEPRHTSNLPPLTPAALRGQQLHRAFAEAGALWTRPKPRPDSPMGSAPGSPAAIRDLLTGIGDALLNESASAAIRGDEHNTGVLTWVEDFVRDAHDSIRD